MIWVKMGLISSQLGSLGSGSSNNIFFQDVSKDSSLFSNMPEIEADFDSVFFWDLCMYCLYFVIVIVQKDVKEIYAVMES